MISQERNAPFGGKVTDIENKTFVCIVTTAKNSLFEGLSTIIHLTHYPEIAKFIYRETLSKSDRQQLHSLVCETIDSAGENGETIKSAISTVIEKLKAQNLLLDSTVDPAFDSVLEFMSKPSIK